MALQRGRVAGALGPGGGGGAHRTPMRVAKVSMPNCWSPSMSGRSLVMAITVANRVTKAVMKLRGWVGGVGGVGGGGVGGEGVAAGGGSAAGGACNALRA